MKKSNKSKWIAFDLDGTIATYMKFVSPTHIGEPIPNMIELLKKYLAEGYTVKIFTARVSVDSQAERASAAIKKWCITHIGQELDVTCVKHTNFVKFYDDRGVHVVKNEGICEGEFDA